jgi:hypothetical protein
MIDDARASDTKVHAAFNQLPGDTTALARPTLTGKGVNRSTPFQTAMMGVCNRSNTAQMAWNWANVTSGAGTDSIEWTYNWGADSLIPGENFVCAEPLESDAGITNNEGMGSPFAGNIDVYPVYRTAIPTGVADGRRESGVGVLTLSVLPNPCFGKARIVYSLPRSGKVSLKLYDVTGKLVTTLAKGYQIAGRYSLLLTPTLSSERRGCDLSSEGRGSSLASARNGSGFAQGVYLLRLQTGSTSMTRKLIVE